MFFFVVCFCFLKHTSASLFNLFSCLVLMHNLLDDVECTVEKDATYKTLVPRIYLAKNRRRVVLGMVLIIEIPFVLNMLCCC